MSRAFPAGEPFARVVNVFRALETLHPNRIAAKVDEYASEEEFDKARATKSKVRVSAAPRGVRRANGGGEQA